MSSGAFLGMQLKAWGLMDELDSVGLIGLIGRLALKFLNCPIPRPTSPV